jgi:hypothetical protein
MTEEQIDFWAPRRCMREPIDDIFNAADLLNRAADAHVAGNKIETLRLISDANMPTVRAWAESLWGAKASNPGQAHYHRFRVVANAAARLPEDQRIPKRMPNAAEKQEIIAKYGRNCVFCGIPLISKEV